MPIILEAHYSKKVGLTNESSHAYSLTLRAELSDPNEIGLESQRLHALLQAAVDRDIQITGYVPENRAITVDPDRARPEAGDDTSHGWQCSGRQRELILTIAEERQMPLSRVEQLAQERFGRELRLLTRPQASRVITHLLAA